MNFLAGAFAATGWLLAAGISTVSAAAATSTHELFAAVETDVILSPRWYPLFPPQPLVKRQQLVCESGFHTCDEIGPPGEGLCCPNRAYCIIDPNDPSKAGCCQLGSICGSPCQPSEYQCLITTTVTRTGSVPGITTTSIATQQACCPRACADPSQFLCPSSLGGGCCGHGSTCAEGGKCLFVPTTSSSSIMSGTISMIPPGCTTGQISCPVSLGGGCCAATQSCTLVAGRAHCVETVPTGVDVDGEEGGGGLSAGAAAGLAVGVVVGCGLMIGGVTWAALRWRRKRNEEVGDDDDDDEYSESSGRPPSGLVGRILGGSGPGRIDFGDPRPVAPEEMEYQQGIGMMPFSERAVPLPMGMRYDNTPITVPGSTAPDVLGRAQDRGAVPVYPNDPGDITTPVEIDSNIRAALAAARAMEGEQAQERVSPTGPPDAVRPSVSPHPGTSTGGQPTAGQQERYELYGDEVRPV